MSFTHDQIIVWLLAYKYWVLFPISIIEGPIITIIAGFLVSLGYLNIFVVYIVLIAGDIIGDLLYYYIGKKGAKPVITRFGKYVGITPEKVTNIERRFNGNVIKTLLFGKLTHAFGSVILFTAGMVNVDLWQFIIYNSIGTAVKTFALLLVGYYFGQAYDKINTYFNQAVIALVVGAVVLAGGWLIARYINTKYFQNKQ